MAISDLADAAEDPEVVPHNVCHTCYALARLPKQEADSLKRLLANPSVRLNRLSRDLAKDPDNPVKVSRNSLSRHVHGTCGVEPLRPEDG